MSLGRRGRSGSFAPQRASSGADRVDRNPNVFPAWPFGSPLGSAAPRVLVILNMILRFHPRGERSRARLTRPLAIRTRTVLTWLAGLLVNAAACAYAASAIGAATEGLLLGGTLVSLVISLLAALVNLSVVRARTLVFGFVAFWCNAVPFLALGSELNHCKAPGGLLLAAAYWGAVVATVVVALEISDHSADAGRR